MPSLALQMWDTDRVAALDGLENAHRALGGSGLGRRIAIQQLNQAYAMMLSSQFQGFCRDLHTECARLLVAPIASPNLRQALYVNAVHGRRLDAGNPNPGNLGTDFNRLGLLFWPTVDVDHPRNPRRKVLLEELNSWRNAIAHQSFAPTMLRGGRIVLPLTRVQSWRKACAGLSRSFDRVLGGFLLALTGLPSW